MKKIVPIIMMLAALTVSAQPVQLRFTAADKQGNYHAFQTVKIVDLNHGWEHTLTYPDTIITLGAGDLEGIGEVEGVEAGLAPIYPNPFKGHTESVLRLDESGLVTMRLVRMNGAVEYEKTAFMEAGDYKLGIDLSNTGMNYLQVVTPSKNYVSRMVNVQNGGSSKVETVQTASAQSRSARKDTKSFSLGDMMRFTASSTSNGAVEYSNSVIRTQLVGETITLLFTTMEVEDCTPKSFSTEQRVFIPDGPYCGVTLYATLDVTGFPQGRTIQSVDEIASVCINYEYSFMGDYDIKLICPNGQTAYLKDKSTGGGSIMTGYPYGGNNHGAFDAESNFCDPLYNMYGVGLDYCFSRNADYLLVDGNVASTNNSGEHHLGDNAYKDDVTYTFEDVGEPFFNEGNNAGTQTFQTKHPSNKETKTDYYRPDYDFDGLEGCPLNGTWAVVIEDGWACDNGWFFGWSMELAPNCGK